MKDRKETEKRRRRVDLKVNTLDQDIKVHLFDLMDLGTLTEIELYEMATRFDNTFRGIYG
jgi:hypothetical protein